MESREIQSTGDLFAGLEKADVVRECLRLVEEKNKEDEVLSELMEGRTEEAKRLDEAISVYNPYYEVLDIVAQALRLTGIGTSESQQIMEGSIQCYKKYSKQPDQDVIEMMKAKIFDKLFINQEKRENAENIVDLEKARAKALIQSVLQERMRK